MPRPRSRPGFSRSPERLAPSMMPVMAGKITANTERSVEDVSVGGRKFSLKVEKESPVKRPP